MVHNDPTLRTRIIFTGRISVNFAPNFAICKVQIVPFSAKIPCNPRILATVGPVDNSFLPWTGVGVTVAVPAGKNFSLAHLIET